MQGQDILAGLEKAVITGNKADSIKYAKDAMAAGVKALDAIDHGLIKGMNIVGDKYATHEFFLPQVLLAADSMYGALDVLLPHIPKADADKKGSVSLAWSREMFTTSARTSSRRCDRCRFRRARLRPDVPSENFVNSAKKTKAQHRRHEHPDDPHHGWHEGRHGRARRERRPA